MKNNPGEVVAYFAGGAFVSGAFLALQSMSFKGIDAAGWLQFVGTVMAMTASAFFVWWQVRRQHVLQMDHVRTRELEEELRILAAFVGVASLGSARLDDARIAIRQNTSSTVVYFRDQRAYADFDIIGAAMILTDARAMSSPSLTLATLAVQKHFKAGCWELDSASLTVDSMNDTKRKALLSRMRPHLMRLTTNLVILMAREGEVLRELGRPLKTRHLEAIRHVETMDAAGVLPEVAARQEVPV